MVALELELGRLGGVLRVLAMVFIRVFGYGLLPFV